MSLNKNKAINLFDDDDEDGDGIDLTSAFDKALKKKQFQGEKGRVLFELQKSINNSDHRFTLDKKFKGDVSYRQLPQSVKETTSKVSQSKDYSYNMMNTALTQDEEIKTERNKNLSILSTLLTNTEYLNYKPKELNTKKLMIKRYDPQLNLGDSGASLIKEEQPKLKAIKEENVIKLEKGVEVFNAPLPNPYLSKHKKEMKRREKEFKMKEKMNEINDNMNGEVSINYDKWKSTIKSTSTSFNLFGDNNDGKEIEKESVYNAESDTLQLKKEKVDNAPIKKRTLIKKEEELTEKEKGKRLLRNKTKREKKKEKMKSLKEKELEAQELLNNEYESLIKDQYGMEKGEEYLKYINMIKKKTK